MSSSPWSGKLSVGSESEPRADSTRLGGKVDPKVETSGNDDCDPRSGVEADGSSPNNRFSTSCSSAIGRCLVEMVRGGIGLLVRTRDVLGPVRRLVVNQRGGVSESPSPWAPLETPT